MDLLRTKIERPQLGRQLVLRQQLIQKLSDPDAYQVAVVTAPAGYGKTTAVVQAVNQGKLPVAWFTITGGDDNVETFWSYAILALCSIIPKLSVAVQDNSSNPIPINHVLTRLVNQLQEQADAFVLVLDDYHQATSSAVCESMSFLIRYMPRNMRLIIISRTRPAFLKEYRFSPRPIQVIGTHDLAFSHREAEEYRGLLGLRFSSEEWEDLVSYSEGWPTGLAILSHGRGRISGPGVPGTDRSQLFTYLNDQIYTRLTPAEQEFVLKTSLVPILMAPLCEELTGRTDSSAVLQRLFDVNAFIEPVGHEGWFRYHGAFGDFLKKRFVQAHNHDVRELHRVAGHWFMNGEYWTQAFQHYSSADDRDSVVELLEKKGYLMLRGGQVSLLEQCLDFLPNEVIESNELLHLFRGWVLFLTGQYEAAREAARGMRPRLSTDRRLMADQSLLITLVESLNREFDVALQSARIASEATDVMGFLTPGISLNTGNDNLLTGILGIGGLLTNVEARLRDLYQPVRDLLPEGLRGAGWLPVLTGELQYERNELDRAQANLLVGLEEALERQAPGVLVPAIKAISRLRWARGDWIGAVDMLADGDRWLAEIDQSDWLKVLDAWRVRLAIETGDSAVVDAWVRKSRLSIPGMLKESATQDYLALARVLLYRNQYYQCETLLSSLRIMEQREKRLHYLIEVLNLQAILYHLMSRDDVAVDSLTKSLELGAPQGYMRTYIDEGAVLAPLLSMVAGQPRDSSDQDSTAIMYARKLIKPTVEFSLMQKKLSDTEQTEERNPYAHDYLTPREKETLALLATEATNAEIASALNVSLATVKFHASNIYSKLGARKRLEALRIARELGLIE